MMLLKAIKEDENTIWLSIAGRLDMAGVREIEMDFAEKTSSTDHSVVVDISEVPFLASLGMRMFLSTAKKLKANNRKIVLLRPNEIVKDALKIAGFESLISLADDETEVNSLVNA